MSAKHPEDARPGLAHMDGCPCVRQRDGMGLFVEGYPATKGSPRLGRNPRTGRPIFLADSQRLRDWTATLQAHLLAARPRWWPTPAAQARAHVPFGFSVEAEFLLPLPKTVRAGPHPAQDVDKLGRALLDAGTGVLWHDDSAVVDARFRKRYVKGLDPLARRAGALVTVRVLYGSTIAAVEGE